MEHQKLVWFAHKKVCGKNARPFRSPGLTPAEVEYTKATAYRADLTALDGTTQTLGKHFESSLGASRDKVFEYLEALQTPSTLRPFTTSFVLGRVRLFLRRSRAADSRDTEQDLSQLLQLDPFTLLGCFASNIFCKLMAPGQPYADYALEGEDWWNYLYQHVVIGAAVWHQSNRALLDMHEGDESVEELANFDIATLQPILSILTSLRRNDKRLATTLVHEVGEISCFSHLSIFLADGVYEAKPKEMEELGMAEIWEC